jgi:hypothetical protein
MLRDASKAPEVCERQDCDEPVAWILHWEDHGAGEPAFACWRHGRTSKVRREPIEPGATVR